MTVPITSSTVSYDCDGIAASFIYAFKILQESDLTVILTDSSGVSTILALNTDYTITGAGNATGGTVVPSDPSVWATGMTLTLERNTDLIQSTDFVDGDGFSSESVEDCIDKAFLASQDQARRILALELGQLPARASIAYVSYLSDFIDLSDAVTQIGSTVTTLVIDTNSTVTASLSAPLTLTIDLPAGRSITIASGQTFTVSGKLLLTGGTLTGAGNFSGTIIVTSGTISVSGAIQLNKNFSAPKQTVFVNPGTITGLNITCPEWFGVDGVNDEVQIQKAHDIIADKGVVVCEGTYTCGATITINVSKVMIEGNNAVFNFSGMATGTAVVLTGNGSGSPYQQTYGGMNGVELIGAGSGTTTIGLKYYSAAEAGPSHTSHRGLNIHAFGTGVSFENNAYVLNFYGCDFWLNGTAIDMPSGKTNYGERITFHGCTIFNNVTLGVQINNSNGAFHFNGCSLDYNTKQVSVLAGKVFLTDCHVEASDYAATPITIANSNGATFVMRGGWLLVTSAIPNSMSSIINCATTANQGGGALFDGVYMNNLQTTTGYFAEGVGTVKIKNYFSTNTSNNPQLLSSAANKLSDGGFETTFGATYATDNWFIFADGAAITDRLNGTNIDAAQSNTYARSGTYSLKLTKNTAAGNVAAYMLAVPVSPGDRAACKFYVKRPGTEAGAVTFSLGYGSFINNASGIPIALRAATHASDSTTLAGGAAVDWTSIAEGEPTERAPEWATHYYINIVMTAVVGSASIYIDDVEVTVM